MTYDKRNSAKRAHDHLRKELDRIDREEAHMSWIDAGMPYFNGTIQQWYKMVCYKEWNNTAKGDKK